MKFTLNITDMTSEEFTTIANKLGIVEVAPEEEKITTPELKIAPKITTPDVDSSGLPWDERIHASTKKLNKDGTWKARKNVDDSYKTFIENELRVKTKQDSLPVEAQPILPVEDHRPLEFVPPAQQSGTTMHQLMARFQELLSTQRVTPNFALQMIQDLNTTYYKSFKSIVDIGQDQMMLDAAMNYINEKVGE